MYVVTGGAGFIGSNIVRALNRRGDDQIIVVDAAEPATGLAALEGCNFTDYVGHTDFREAVKSRVFRSDIKAIFHEGACTDTTVHDEVFMMDTNFEYSKDLLGFALAESIPLVYASSAAVYGTNADTTETPENEAPLNVYGRSKLAFDQHVRKVALDASSTVVGLRYFNVFGPGESRKGHMASMVLQLRGQIEATGSARLFEGTDGYGDGEQRRDFVFVDDIVNANLWFADGPTRTGVFNIGTGKSRSFNDLARAVIASSGSGEIEYIPFPDSLQGRYQSFTEADVTSLRGAGYDREFTSLEDGVARYA
jgi:ADP-L-glycero-D-manno-heptose 6-epimerase